VRDDVHQHRSNALLDTSCMFCALRIAIEERSERMYRRCSYLQIRINTVMKEAFSHEDAMVRALVSMRPKRGSKVHSTW